MAKSEDAHPSFGHATDGIMMSQKLYPKHVCAVSPAHTTFYLLERGMDTLKVLRATPEYPSFRRRWQAAPCAGLQP